MTDPVHPTIEELLQLGRDMVEREPEEYALHLSPADVEWFHEAMEQLDEETRR